MISQPRIGIDMGGTKIAAIALGTNDEVLIERRIATPRGDYAETIASVGTVVEDFEAQILARASVGIGMPGSISPGSGLVQNANSTWLNAKDFQRDIQARLGRKVRLANDANCFALSEATDGAAQGADIVFGVIIGTGCGGSVVVDGRLLQGRHHITGEWGHTPLPWPRPEEYPGPSCWCGQQGCLETWVSGTGLENDYQRSAGTRESGETIVQLACTGNSNAKQALERHADRLARGLAMVINIVDPDAIVLGGGLSNMTHLYEHLPGLISPHIFTDTPCPDIRPPLHGDTSGVRGAARLWDNAHG
jgi:fructokinase